MRVANRVHERVCVRMAVQTLRMRDLDAAEDEFASRDQRVDVIANAYMNHNGTIKPASFPTKINSTPAST